MRAKTTTAVPVLNPPVVSAANRVWILDFVHCAGIGWSVRPHDNIFRRWGWIAIRVAEPDRIAKAKHDAVQTGSAHSWLMVVVAHGVIVGELLEVGHVALQNVIEAHDCATLAGGFCSRRIVGAEVGRLGLAIHVRTYGNCSPGKKIGFAATRIRLCGISNIAVGLLPHLVEAVNRAGGVRIPCKSVRALRISELEGSARKGGVGSRANNAGYAGVGNLAGKASPASGQVAVVRGVRQAILRSFGIGEGTDSIALADIRRTAIEGSGERGIRRLVSGAELEFGAARDISGVLSGKRILWAGCAVLIDDLLGEKIVNVLSVLWLVSGKNVVETAIFSNNHYDMLDGGAGELIPLGLKGGNERAAQAELEHGQDNEPDAKTFNGL